MLPAKHKDSNPRPKMNEVILPGDAKHPMLQTACDLFSAVGKQWLALVDRFSGYGWTTPLRKLDTRGVTQHLENWFNKFGWPTHIRTDGGPQFRSEFKDFCASHGIQHEPSSPYNPESNGLAEAAVKNLKSIVTRCTEKGENIHISLAKHEPPRRKLSSAALLRQMTATRVASTTMPLRREPPAATRCKEQRTNAPPR